MAWPYSPVRTMVDGSTFWDALLGNDLQTAINTLYHTRDDILGRGTDADPGPGFGTITLTRDMEYASLTMNATDVINTGGYVIRVRQALTCTAGAQFTVPPGSTSIQGTWGAGGRAGAAQTNGDSVTGIGGVGGAGGTVGGSQGSGGSVTTPTWAWKVPPQLMLGAWTGYKNGVPTSFSLQGGAGGGGGGNNGGTGGAGGGGGGVLLLMCQNVNGAFTVNVQGQAGVAGAANGNGGGGGGGGAAVIVYYVKNSMTATVNAGGGSGGAGNGTGATGSAGGSGVGTIIELAFPFV